MKRSSWYFALAGLVALLMAVESPAHAGWVAVDKNGDKNLIGNGIVKNTSPRRDEWSLMDVNAGTLTMVSDKNKAYTSSTARDFCETISGMQKQMMSGARGRAMPDVDKMMKGMNEAMKDMSPEQRQMMEQMMGRTKRQLEGMQEMGRERGKVPASAVSVAEAGTGDIVAGFKTTHYRVSVGGRVAKELWLTADPSLMNDIKPYMNKFLQMSQDIRRCTSMRRSMMGAVDLEGSEAYQKLLEKGYPMKEKDIRSGWMREVVRLEKTSIPDAELALPEGYKKVSFMELMQSQMGRRSR